MAEITRAVTPSDLIDLLQSSGRAVVAWGSDGDVVAEPARFRFVDGRYLIGLPGSMLADGSEVSVVVDAGPFYFDLRGVRVRGRAALTGERTETGAEWFEVHPALEVAWHYGTLRAR